MHEKKMESVDCDVNSKSGVIPWRFETNWTIAQGSLESSVTVESSDDPIDDSGPENSACKPPLVLKRRGPDSGPCEIKISFDQKYEVGQVYVRSTARTYEIYCTRSRHSINEYFCTVRCGVAERDNKVLKTNCIEDVVEEHGEGPSGELTAESATDGGNVVTGEDDWINIKAPEVERGSASDKISTNGLNNIQDFYEATAQISDSDPCLSLTIRLLSLQDKGHVYLDEIYVFVDPVESTNSGNEALMAGSSTESSLMAMFMPTLLQLSKSGVSQIQEKCPSDEVLKDGKMETGSRITDKINCHQQYVTPKELDKDTAESSEPQQHTSVKKCVEPKNIDDLPPGHLDIALEQLISRLSRVEDICLRFEEKMLKPIESIEARLQKVEIQLEKLAQNSHDFGLAPGTRISAPAFSCCESNSSSLYNDQTDYPPRGASDLEKKDFSCNNAPELTNDANFHPSLVICAPEFSCGEGEEDTDDLNPRKDSPRVKPKKTLSLDDAFAASLNGFLSTAAINPSEHIPRTVGLSCRVNEENQCQEHTESCQVKTQECPAAENGNREPLQNAQVLTVKAPDFAAEETGNEEHLNYTQSSLDIVSVTENEDHHGDGTVLPSNQSNCVLTSADSRDFGKNESTDDFDSASNGDFPAVSVKISGTCPGNKLVNQSSELNMIETCFEGETSSAPAGVSNGSSPDLANDSVKTSKHPISDETNSLGKSTNFNKDDRDNASELVFGHETDSDSEVLEHVALERCLKDDIPNVSENSRASSLDFEFPILEVKFTSDAYTSTKSALEALLGGVAESNIEAPSVDATSNDDGNETTDLLPVNHLLVDLGVSAAADDSSSLEGISHNLFTPSSPEINVSLI